ncbi:MAG: malto-oligosyltrehalose trehalohydrolase, partial [Proteobacteria bacterium]
KRIIKMEKAERGYFFLKTSEAPVGTRYRYRFDEKTELPDPASRYQPEGPHGPSEVVPTTFAWTDRAWSGLDLKDLVIYELHVGTFTEQGTFAGVREKIPHLKKLGINAIEIMPVAQFAGGRNWGYDGVGLFAPQNTYGSPGAVAAEEMKALVNECHANGIAVILDVVYNHLGPEGNYLPQLGNYFQSKYKTPWGDALNYDGEDSDEVRNYFLQNARQWFEDFHLDGLRLDAVHAIFDTSAYPFLAELADLKQSLEKKLSRSLFLIAESDASDPRILKSTEDGGHGMDGHWADDLHHVVHTLLTKEKHHYYADYGEPEQLVKVLKNAMLFEGEYSPFRRRRHGRSYNNVDRRRLMVCSQNHDQIGNRKDGERLIAIAGAEKQKMAAACVLLSGALPMIFMGEEFAETAPFQYFVDHTDKDLLEAVRKGRKAEFASSQWEGEAPDPASADTFRRSKLDWQRVGTDPQAAEFQAYYRRLIELSKWIRATGFYRSEDLKVEIPPGQKRVEISATKNGEVLKIYMSYGDQPQKIPSSGVTNLEIALNSSENDGSNSSAKVLTETLDLKPFGVIVLRSR